MTFLDYRERGFCVLIQRAEKSDIISVRDDVRDKRAKGPRLACPTRASAGAGGDDTSSSWGTS